MKERKRLKEIRAKEREREGIEIKKGQREKTDKE